ncbi:MAG: DNA polymerase I [Bacillota bacterium]
MSCSSQESDPVLLVDGTSLVYRAFFAISNLTAPDGRPTNAVYGFTNMLLRLIEDSECDCIVVAFDRGEPSYRLEVYPDYKGHRPEMPADLRPQFDMVREVLDGLGIPRIEIDGVEADDIIGTMARRLSESGRRSVVVTGDKDLLQLVSDDIEVRLTRRGITEMENYDLQRVRSEYGVEPRELIDVKALMGDSSDNVPGVPGVGEKTALKLVKKIGSLEEVLERPEMAGGKAIPARLRENADRARMSRVLVEIHTDIETDLDVEGLRPPEIDREALGKVLSDLGFERLLERLDIEIEGDHAESVPLEERSATDWMESGEVDALQGRLAVDWWSDDDDALRIAFAADSDSGVLLSGESEDVADAAAELLDSPPLEMVGHELGEFLARVGVGRPRADLFDVELAAYLLDPARSSYPLDTLSRSYLESSLTSGEGEEGAGTRLDVLLGLRDVLETELRALEVWELFSEIERPLLPILARMRLNGITVDRDILAAQGEELRERIEEVEQKIWERAGHEFNVSSPKQLGEVLFEEMELPVIKKTKTGYSTDAEVLGQLSVDHPIADDVLEYRSLVKLRGYVSGLSSEIDPDTGRIHSTFHQAVTATGRLSSSDPNLQNIPIREETGRRLRRAFVAPEGQALLAADYSQIELRVLAHFSEDRTLIESFTNDEDIHRRTASEVFDVPMDEVTSDLRNAAKAVNFGIIYGISAFGLSRNLKIDPDRAQEYIDGYLERLPGVRRYMDDVVDRAREDGYVRTLFGRIRYLPEINHRVYHRRAFAERMALNTPIQGTAADIIKKAMVALEGDAGAHGEKLLLQVHDELIWEVPESRVDSLASRAKETMEAAADLAVPLKVDFKSGPNWYDLQRLEVES